MIAEHKVEIASARFDAARFQPIDEDLTIYFFISNTVEVKGLGSQSWKYSIHENPVPEGNATNSEISPSTACDNVGDKLSEGVLEDSASLQQANNIIGRYLVIHKPDDDDSKMCATISSGAKYMKTKFTSVVDGTVEFMQDSANGDTTVAINLQQQNKPNSFRHWLRIAKSCGLSTDGIVISQVDLPYRNVITVKANKLKITRDLQDSYLWISVPDNLQELDCVPLARTLILLFISVFIVVIAHLIFEANTHIYIFGPASKQRRQSRALTQMA